MSEKIQKKMIRTTSMSLRGEDVTRRGNSYSLVFVFEATTAKAAQVHQFRYSSVLVSFFTRRSETATSVPFTSLKCFSRNSR